MAKTAGGLISFYSSLASLSVQFYSPYVQQHHTIGAWLEEHCRLCPTRGKGCEIYESNLYCFRSLALRKAVKKSNWKTVQNGSSQYWANC